MNKVLLRRIALLALALALVTTGIVGGTLAMYKTEVNGTGSITAAKWNFTVGNQAEDVGTGDYTLSLVPEEYSNVASGMIAPGTTGKFTVCATNDSDVDAVYTITFTAENVPANLKFYQSTDGTTKGAEITAAEGTYTVKTDDVLTEADTETTYVMWEWAYGAEVEVDQNDIATGYNEMSVIVNVTGMQVLPVTTP